MAELSWLLASMTFLDSPWLYAVAVVIASMTSTLGIVDRYTPKGAAPPNWFMLASGLVLIGLEIAYVRIGRKDLKIIQEFEQISETQHARVRRIAITYALVVFAGGGTSLVLILKALNHTL